MVTVGGKEACPNVECATVDDRVSVVGINLPYY